MRRENELEVPAPVLIQGGMGAGVSNWRLAQAVARAGQLGVVSGTALDTVMVRRLQDGDDGGHLRRALRRFPLEQVCEDILRRYFNPDGRAAGRPYRRIALHSHRDGVAAVDLCVAAAFVEVALAREGHDGPVGINLLTKIQLPTVPTLFGAMLAGADYVLMGAGIPLHIPGILDALARGERVESSLEVAGRAGGDSGPSLRFEPSRYGAANRLRRPSFMPIVSSHVLATMLARKSSGSVDGFVVERPVAGGHNAPPRGAPVFDPDDQPIYGERDHVDWSAMRALGLPFWVAGGITSEATAREAFAEGAAGVQVGTLFAFCRESGVAPALRREVLELVRAGAAQVHTDARVSSTGYPFKVLRVAGTVSDPRLRAARERICDLGYLREAYAKPGGGIGYRCAGEPVDAYVGKGGAREDTVGRACLCNSLLATIGLGQMRTDGSVEPPLVTSGDGLAAIRDVLGDAEDYSAADVIKHVLGEPARRAAGVALTP